MFLFSLKNSYGVSLWIKEIQVLRKSPLWRSFGTHRMQHKICVRRLASLTKAVYSVCVVDENAEILPKNNASWFLSNKFFFNWMNISNVNVLPYLCVQNPPAYRIFDYVDTRCCFSIRQSEILSGRYFMSVLLADAIWICSRNIVFCFRCAFLSTRPP